jgi:hypothetical protein
MGRDFEKGDHVRGTIRNRQAGYLPGEVGAVVAGPETLRATEGAITC